jgi:hypothetical protein
MKVLIVEKDFERVTLEASTHTVPTIERSRAGLYHNGTKKGNANAEASVLIHESGHGIHAAVWCSRFVNHIEVSQSWSLVTTLSLHTALHAFTLKLCVLIYRPQSTFLVSIGKN